MIREQIELLLLHAERENNFCPLGQWMHVDSLDLAALCRIALGQQKIAAKDAP